MKTAQALAQAVLAQFRRQRRSGRLGRSAEFARVLQEPLLGCYLAGLKAAKAPKETVEDAVDLVRRHAADLAKQLNESSESMSFSRDLSEVFGPDRAALVGVHEDDVARQAAVALAAKARGQVLVWRNGRKPCDFCKRQNGKRRRPGKAFAMLNGKPVYHAPAHPSCNCTTEAEEA